MERDISELLDNLRFLGLTQTQARVYITSLRLGVLTAKQISSEAGMNIAVTYRRIKELSKMNLLEVRLGSPNKYEAVHPHEVLKRLLERSEAEVRYRRHLVGRVDRELSALIDQRPSRVEAAMPPEIAYRLVRGRDRLFDESQRLRRQTERELSLIIPALGLRRLVRHGYVQEVAECVRRGVNVRIITEITNSNIIESSRLASLVSMRHYPKISFRLGVYDREKLHIGAAYDEDLTSDGSNDIYLLISDPALASSMAVLFDAVWEKSRKSDSVLKRLEVRYPSSLQ